MNPASVEQSRVNGYGHMFQTAYENANHNEQSPTCFAAAVPPPFRITCNRNRVQNGAKSPYLAVCFPLTGDGS